MPPEGGFAVWLASKYSGYEPERIVSEARTIAESIMTCKKMDTWRLPTKSVVTEIENGQPQTWANVVDLVYRLYAKQSGKPLARWGDKNNFYLNHIEDLLTLFPNAQFLHVVRDPRNVAASYRRINLAEITGQYAPNLPDKAEEMAHHWLSNVTKVVDSLDALPPAQALHVRYEDLTNDPRETLSDVCGFLGESFDSRMLDFHHYNKALQLEPPETMAWKEKTLSPVQASDSSGFSDVIAPSEAKTISNACSTLMQRFHYDGSNS